MNEARESWLVARVPLGAEVIHEHEDHVVYIEPSGHLKIAFRGGIVELTPGQWMAKFCAGNRVCELLANVPGDSGAKGNQADA